MTICEEVFGWELILDLHNCNPNKLRSREIIISFITELCNELDMKRYGEPWAERFGFGRPKAIGYTLVQLIETSSIVMHFSEEKNAAYFEVFSCKPFEKAKIVEFCQNYFEAETIKEHFLIRE